MWLFGWTSNKELSFSVATVSDRGLVRSENQDSFFADAAHGVFGVADGMGGGEGGALASAWVCEGLSIAAETFAGITADERYAVVDDVLQRTNKRIRAYAQEKGFRMMGSTVALASFDAPSGALQLVHAGDSRVYRLRRKRLEQLTRDHTVGDELSRIVPGEGGGGRGFRSRRNPLTHILTRAVGTELRARPDLSEIEVKRGDRFLLCSDGVHDMLLDNEISTLLREASSPSVAISRLSAAVKNAGAADNFTMNCIFA